MSERTQTRRPDALSRGDLKVAFGSMFLIIIFLQKFALPVGGVSVVFVGLCVFMGRLVFLGRMMISPLRLVLYCALVASAISSQLLSGQPFSVTSLLFLILLYAPMVPSWTLSRSDWLEVVGLFLNMMLVPAAMVLIQVIWQSGLRLHPLSIEPLIPRPLRITGYVYESPLVYGRPQLRPNGLFMLEPSFISAFTASALVLETLSYRRLWRLGLYAAALFLSTGVTGLVLAGVAAPFILVRERAPVILALIGMFLIVGITAGAAGGFSALDHRMSELGNADSSGFGRMIAPAIQIGETASHPGTLLMGAGAGNLDIAINTAQSAWPLVKIFIEYGLLTALLFFAFTVVCAWGSPAPALTVALLFVFHFTGGYLLNFVLPSLMVLMISSLRVSSPAPRYVRLAAGPHRSRVLVHRSAA